MDGTGQRKKEQKKKKKRSQALVRCVTFAVLFTERSEGDPGAKRGRGAMDGYHPLRIFVRELYCGHEVEGL